MMEVNVKEKNKIDNKSRLNNQTSVAEDVDLLVNQGKKH